ncbi:MAG: tRNA dihydrouridine synthase DusB [Candidatus Gastranaerophilales bacterium]|nr:tRNA dihydrouridine synthase DusB [Candidatus Gastranaerophilales bacterium]MCM1072917.1 tRNA dihydrouridine synthase DusB [Bacteroides sp.]
MLADRVNTLIASRVSLAPMAGITDYVLRSLVREHSKSCLLTTEMISSEALTQVKDTDIVKRDENHSPISYQLSGHKPKMMADSAEYLQRYADMIDINMGCPVNKVVKGTDGAALMRNVDLAQEIVRTVKSQISIPLSVKFRLGYTMDELNYVEYGQKMQEAGADFITIHGRTRSQMYGGKADWKRIAELKRNVDIPVFANGDVVSIETAVQCLEESQADGVAIGRGVLGDVTLISRIEQYLNTGEYLPPPTLEQKIDDMKKHLLREIEFRGEDIGIKFVRKFYPYYVNGFQGASRCRGELVMLDDLKEILSLLDRIILQNRV